MDSSANPSGQAFAVMCWQNTIQCASAAVMSLAWRETRPSEALSPQPANAHENQPPVRQLRLQYVIVISQHMAKKFWSGKQKTLNTLCEIP